MAPSPRPSRHAFTLRAHLSETSHARQLVLPFAVEAGFSEDRCFDIQVASSEACANAIEHSPADSEVGFTVLAYPDRLEIQVEGRGEFELPAVAAGERVRRGLGLPLMAKLSDHMALYSGPRGGTLIALTFYRPGFRDEPGEDVTPPSIAALLEDNEFVAAITDTAPVGLYVLDPELRFRWANPTYREFLEEPYRSRPLEGVFIGDVVPGSETMDSLRVLQKVSRTGERTFFPEYEFVGFGRGTTYWRWEILPLAQERSEPPYDVLVVISEITGQVEQRRRLDALAAETAARAGQLQGVLDASAVAIWVAHDPESRVITGNLYADEIIMGVKRGGNISRSAPPGTADVSYTVWRDGRELRPDELPAQIAATTAQAVFDQEFELRFPDGRVVHMLANAVPVLDADGKVTGSVTVALDVTERKRIEEELRHREQEARHLLRHAPTSVYEIDFRGPKFISVNDAMCEQSGYSRAELLDTNPMDLLDEESRLRFAARIRKALAGEEPTDVVEYKVKVKDGPEPWAVLNVSLIYEEGKPVRALVIGHDVTDRKRAEEELRKSEEKYRNLFESIEEMVTVYEVERDEDGRIGERRLRDANRAFLRAVGVSSVEEIRGKTSSEVFGEAWAESHLSAVQEAMDTGQAQIQEVHRPESDRHYVTSVVRLDAHTYLGAGWDITARRQAEEALRRSEGRWNAAIENFANGVIIATEDEQVIYWNPAAREMHGFTLENEGIGPLEETSVTFELWATDGSHLLELDEWPMRRIKRGETVRNLELRIRRPDQGWEKVFSYSGAMVDTVDEERLIFLTCHDLTELRRTEEALRASEARLKRSQNIAHLGSWELDLERNELVWSDEVYRIFGLEPQEFGATYEAFLERIHPEDRTAVDAAYSSSLRDRVDSYEIEHRVVRKNTDEVRWVQERCEHMRNSDGRIIRSVGMVLDITERKQAEEALRHSQVALQKARDQLEDRVRERTVELALANQELASAGIYARSLIEASLDPLLTIGPDGKITDVNEATVKITGYERNELIGSDFSDYFTDPERARSGYREVFDKGFVTDYPLTIRDQDAKLTDVLYNASLYKDQEGKVLGVFAAARDITALRLLEEQRTIAGRLQQALLDIPQQARGVRFGHLYRSATEQAQVGGDFYDVFEAKDGRIALLIGDVSGHGLEAARVATLVKDIVHAFAHQFRRPHLVLRETNRLLVEKHLSGFVTAFLGLLDPERGTLTYSSAGHPPPLLTADGRAQFVESIGFPLGVFAIARYRDAEVEIPREALLLLYTDGITEARRDGEIFGEVRLSEVLARVSDRPIEELPSLLLGEALSFSGGALQDDVALLAVSYLGATAEEGS